MLQPPGIHPAPAFRLLAPGDARELMELRHRALRECPEVFGTPARVELAKTAHHYRRQLQRYRRSGQAVLLGCWRGPQLCGMAGLKQRLWQGETVGLIYSLYLDPPLRGQGLGKSLIQRGQQELFARWHLKRCLMHVETNNHHALRLYEDCGFEIVGTERQAFWIEGVPHDVFVLEAGG